MTTDEYEVLKSFAEYRFMTIGRFARGAMRSEIRKRQRDKYWLAELSTRSVETAKEIMRTPGDGEVKVYFIHTGEFIKIGIARDVQHRMRQLQGSNPQDMELIACFDGSRELEERLHDRFKHCRHRGEWFHATPEIFEFIKAMKKEVGSLLAD